jgi:hypothetical protein
MSADGTDDEYITPEGTTSYRFVRLDPSTTVAVDDNAPTGVEPPDSDDDDAPQHDADFDALPGGDAQAQELGVDDPELAPADLLSFAEMVKMTVAPGDQLRMLSATPPLDATLVGKRVAVRNVDIGWCAGKVCHRTSRSTVTSYNYAVRYDADDVQEQWLTAERYVGSSIACAENDWNGLDAHPPGSWAVFATSVLPRASEAGRVGGLRGAPSWQPRHGCCWSAQPRPGGHHLEHVPGLPRSAKGAEAWRARPHGSDREALPDAGGGGCRDARWHLRQARGVHLGLRLRHLVWQPRVALLQD